MVETHAPAVSVIIPTYNRDLTLVRAVQSVFAQTFTSYEIIIVDDASTVDPVLALGELACDPRIRILRHSINMGASAARNNGVREARGRFVAFLDSDDEWMPAKLAAQYDAACARPNPDRIFCVVQSTYLRPGGRSEVRPARGAVPGEPFDEYLYVYGALTQTSSFFVARALALAHPFREDLPQYEDHLFFIECCQSGGDYSFIQTPLSVYHAEHAMDRLSATNDVAKCELYLSSTAGLLSRRARYAFEVRYLARFLIADRPTVALGLFARAVLLGALRPRFAFSFLLRFLRLRR